MKKKIRKKENLKKKTKKKIEKLNLIKISKFIILLNRNALILII